jgi:hypothetical protein
MKMERRGKNIGSQAQTPITWLRNIPLPSFPRLRGNANGSISRSAAKATLMAPSLDPSPLIPFLQFGILLWQVSDEGKVSSMYTVRKKIKDKGIEPSVVCYAHPFINRLCPSALLDNSEQ